MFTGIIQAIGIVRKIIPSKAGLRLKVAIEKKLPAISRGSSISVNGACLTATQIRSRNFTFDIIPETIRKTTLGSLKAGDTVNIEWSLRVGDELSGHLVVGHVDGMGIVKSIRHRGKEVVMTIVAPEPLMHFIVPKGSVAIDGVSLTIVSAKSNSFSVALIPFTLAHTTLGKRIVGDRVNIETDIMIRYLKKLL